MKTKQCLHGVKHQCYSYHNLVLTELCYKTTYPYHVRILMQQINRKMDWHVKNKRRKVVQRVHCRHYIQRRKCA